MRFEEGQQGRLHARLGGAGAQIGGVEAGQRKQPLGPIPVLQRPRQRRQGKRLRIFICWKGLHGLQSSQTGSHKGESVTKKVLVVEDNELNLKLFCDLLRAHDYIAEPVRDGREAVERAREFAPDLVIMDIQLPNVSGLELIEQLKADEQLRPIPIMAVTAYAAKGDEERIRAAGAEAYVSKPISVLRFVESVEALV